MNTTILLVAAGIAIVAVFVLLVTVRSRSQSRTKTSGQLREQFGTEYDRAVLAQGSQSAAEKELAKREKRVRGFNLQPLSAGDWARFTGSWQQVQADFVDDPTKSVDDADRLVGEVMATRGYPTSEFEQRAADISVDHPEFVNDYRQAHEIALREDQGASRTEDLRGAMIYTRSLFNDLLGIEPAAPAPDVEAVAAA